MMKNCDLCGTLSYHSPCVTCHIPNVCPNCKDTSGRCKRCQPATASSRSCGRCYASDTALDGQCWSCQRLLCSKCVANRSPQGVLCERCLPAAGKTTEQRRLLCPGCGKTTTLSHLESSFCASCSRPVCNACFPLTLRKGVVQCHLCNPAALRPAQESPAPPQESSSKIPPPQLGQQLSNLNISQVSATSSVAGTVPLSAANSQVPASRPQQPPTPTTAAANSQIPASRPHQLPPKKSAPPQASSGPQSPPGSMPPAIQNQSGQQRPVLVDGRQIAVKDAGMPLPALGRTIFPSQRISLFAVDGEEELVVVGVTAEGGSLVVRPADGDESKSKVLQKSQLEFIIVHDDPAAGGGNEGPATPSSPANSTDPNRYRNLTQLEVLGQGAQGTVYKCKTAGGELVVSKEMIFAPRDEAAFNQGLRQVQAMQKLSHHHLIQYLDVIPTKLPSGFKISVIMPYYHESDLAMFIKKQQRPLGEHRMCSLLLQVALALQYLHNQSPPIAHRDVKPENILMRQQGEQALLMDLDTCREMTEVAPRGGRTILGTMEYMAPEVLYGNSTVKCDVWSLGVVAFALAALPEFMTLSFSGQNILLNAREWTEVLLTDAVTRAINRNFPSYSTRLVTLICRMLRHEETRRPDMNTVVAELRGVLEDNLLRGA